MNFPKLLIAFQFFLISKYILAYFTPKYRFKIPVKVTEGVSYIFEVLLIVSQRHIILGPPSYKPK